MPKNDHRIRQSAGGCISPYSPKFNLFPFSQFSAYKSHFDDASLFTRVEGVDQTQVKIIKDLQTVSHWAHQWKMGFNPDITKQAIEVIFSVKKNKPDRPELIFNDIPVARQDHTKHLGVFLDSRLNFSKHIKEAIINAKKGISLLKYLSKYVSWNVLDTCYKLYVRPHLDYGDVIYHNQRADLMNSIEQVQYKAAFIVSGCWKGTCRFKLYDELGWESLSERRCARRMTMFYKISNGMAPSYLSDHIPARSIINISLRSRNTNPPFSRTDRYDNSFFPFCIKNWNNLDDATKSLPSLIQFKKRISLFVCPKGTSCYDIRDNFGTTVLTKIRVSFSDLRDHRFSHSFNCSSPICSCGIDDGTPTHYFLCCPRYNTLRITYLSKISEIIGSNVSILPYDHLIHILMYGSNVFNVVSNKAIINETLAFIKRSGRFKKLEAFN